MSKTHPSDALHFTPTDTLRGLFPYICKSVNGNRHTAIATSPTPDVPSCKLCLPYRRKHDITNFSLYMKLGLSFFFFNAAVCNIKKGEKTQQISNNIETSPPLSLQTWSGAAYCSTSNYIIPSNCVLMVKKKKDTWGYYRPHRNSAFLLCNIFSLLDSFSRSSSHFFYKVNERGHCSSGCFQWSLTPLQLGIRPACLTEVRRAYLLCVIQNVLGRCRADSGCENSGKSAK